MNAKASELFDSESRMNAPLDDKPLRKAWLKRKFASWEYHEELLKLHDEYLSALHRHWCPGRYPEAVPGGLQGHAIAGLFQL